MKAEKEMAVQRARQLRRRQTDAEVLLWRLLRGRMLLGHKFRRQHPVPPYILDFYCPHAKLAIELDGGGHAHGRTRLRDETRTAFLGQAGIRVLRFWNTDVLFQTDAVLTVLLGELGKPPSP